MAVLVAAYGPEARADFENAIASALRARGIAASTTYTTISINQAARDKAAALKEIGSVDAVLVVRPADRLSMSAFTISPGNSGESLQPWQNWFDYFSAKGAFAGSPAGMGGMNEIGIHAALYEAPSGRLLWSATTVQRVSGSEGSAQAVATGIVRRLAAAALIK